jgi:hypothetical protein
MAKASEQGKKILWIYVVCVYRFQISAPNAREKLLIEWLAAGPTLGLIKVLGQ